jgi:hypothetical protein
MGISGETGGHFAQSGRREHVQPVANLASPQMIVVASSGWYHDEAIREERPRKN